MESLLQTVDAVCESLLKDAIDVDVYVRQRQEAKKLQDLATSLEAIRAHLPDADLTFLDDALEEQRAVLKKIHDEIERCEAASAQNKKSLERAIEELKTAYAGVEKREADVRMHMTVTTEPPHPVEVATQCVEAMHMAEKDKDWAKKDWMPGNPVVPADKESPLLSVLPPVATPPEADAAVAAYDGHAWSAWDAA